MFDEKPQLQKSQAAVPLNDLVKQLKVMSQESMGGTFKLGFLGPFSNYIYPTNYSVGTRIHKHLPPWCRTSHMFEHNENLAPTVKSQRGRLGGEVPVFIYKKVLPRFPICRPQCFCSTCFTTWSRLSLPTNVFSFRVLCACAMPKKPKL